MYINTVTLENGVEIKFFTESPIVSFTYEEAPETGEHKRPTNYSVDK